ncbi:MAG: permease prefix domain 1-containing protein [Chloroflexota bacterium]|nr:permease prefix domain 1-containing protein [Chloroflexota bacterium]
MKLLKLYLEEIRNYLPAKNREDILKEIRSTLMDMIEDQNPNPGQDPDEEAIRAALKAFGAPRKVAQQYADRNYLIGPRMFPIYLQVLKIVLIVVSGLNVLGVIVSLVSQSGIDAGVFETSMEVLGGLFSSLFTAFGIVTLSFAGIERTTPEEWKDVIKQEWTPDDLLKQEDQERIKITGLALEITLTLVFIALLNFFLDRIGIYYLVESGWVSTPILNEDFLRYIPWITAYCIMDIGLNLYLIRKGYWDKVAAIAKVFINVFKIAVTYAILKGPAIITISPSAWQTLNSGLQTTAQGLSQTLNTILKVLLGLHIFGKVVESIKRIYDTFIKGRHVNFDIESESL